jgi:ketosteroid isomerase-like protein
MSDNVALIRDFYDARAAGDRDRVRAILDSAVAWHDPYPAPHGGDLVGAEVVLRDIFEAAGELTGGSTRLWLHDVVANKEHAVALVNWSSQYRGHTMESREVAVFHVRDGRITEAWFYPQDPAAAEAFFAPEPASSSAE